MPGDRFTFAVGVSCKDQFTVFGQCIGDGFDMFAAVRANLPFHVEPVFSVDRSVLGRKVTHVAIRGQHGVIGAEIFIDGLGFGRGFDNDDRHLAQNLLSNERRVLWRGNMWCASADCQSGLESGNLTAIQQVRLVSAMRNLLVLARAVSLAAPVPMPVLRWA